MHDSDDRRQGPSRPMGDELKIRLHERIDKNDRVYHIAYPDAPVHVDLSRSIIFIFTDTDSAPELCIRLRRERPRDSGPCNSEDDR